MAYYFLEGQKFFIDTRLKERIDYKIIPDLKKRDMDCVFIVDGKERMGKSVFAMSLAGYVSSVFKKKFNLSNICMNHTELRNRIMNAEKNDSIIYDEAHGGMGSSGALTEVNRLLKDMMMEMGQKNLMVIVVLPTYFLLERYIALFRTRGLFHVYTNKGKRGFWVYYNEKKKKFLYLKGKKDFNYNCMKYPRLRGVFTNQYTIDENEYREKKSFSFTKKSRMTKEEKFREDVRRLMALLHDEYGLSTRKIEELIKKYDVRRSHNTIAEDIITYTTQ